MHTIGLKFKKIEDLQKVVEINISIAENSCTGEKFS